MCQLTVTSYHRGDHWSMLEVHSAASGSDHKWVSCSSLEHFASHKALNLWSSGNRNHKSRTLEDNAVGKKKSFSYLLYFLNLWELLHANLRLTSQSTLLAHLYQIIWASHTQHRNTHVLWNPALTRYIIPANVLVYLSLELWRAFRT